MRYLGERHGDAEHTEHVDDYVVADLGVHYRYEDASFVEALKVSLNLYNLFDTEYVSMISASDDAQSGKASYYVGAPLTAVLSVGVEF